MQYLNKQIAALAKKKRSNLVRPQISCGIFQELPEEEMPTTRATTKN